MQNKLANTVDRSSAATCALQHHLVMKRMRSTAVAPEPRTNGVDLSTADADSLGPNLNIAHDNPQVAYVSLSSHFLLLELPT